MRVQAQRWYPSGLSGCRPPLLAFFNCGAIGFGVAQVWNQDHIRAMASRRPAFPISKLNDGAIPGLPIFVGLIVLSASYFGL
jgi:hypothetical protein